MRVHTANLPIRILTHNIRYAADPPSKGEKPWCTRKQLLLNQLHYQTLHNAESFICLQEALHPQLVDIMCGLGADWAYIGVGRDDGKTKGEFNPILYRPAIWHLVKWHTVWLNETGAVGKKGWDAGCVRIITIGTFQHRPSKKTIVAMSTHLDNAGPVSRRESAKLIQNIVANLTTDGPLSTSTCTPPPPFFLAGDLNSETHGAAYQILNSAHSALQDAKEHARWVYGNRCTFTDFQDGDEGMAVIDFVFLGPRGAGAGAGEWQVEGYSVLGNRFEDGVFVSDHRAVVVDGVVRV